MWLFYEYGNYIPVGSDGAMKVPNNVKSMLSLRKLASGFLAGRPGRIYCMRTWTQEMSEMGCENFIAYVMRYGQLLVWSEGYAPQGR